MLGSRIPASAGDWDICANGSGQQAIDACSRYIRKNPRSAVAFYARGLAWHKKGNFDKAISDYNKAIELNPKDADAFYARGFAWGNKGNFDKVISDSNKAIELNPKYADAFINRGFAWGKKGNFDKAISDSNKAIELNPKNAVAFNNRGNAWNEKGNFDKAIADLNKAIEINPKYAYSFYNRGIAWEKLDNLPSALADFKKFAELDPNHSGGPKKIAEIERKIASAAQSTTSVSSQANATSTKRVALLIGNTNYKHQAALENPANDVELIGRTLRSAGFSKVVIEKDLTREGIYSALNRFSKIAGRADFSLVHYAGHAIQVSGRNFIIPVDASLETDTQIDLQTIDANVVLAAISGSKKLRVLILDACRDNPFASQMKRMMSSRSISRGLARMETVAGQLISFAAAAGQLADDGEGKHSPFALALAKRISQDPAIEVRRLFDFVRDDVMQQTNKKQQPFTYHSLPARLDFYFNR